MDHRQIRALVQKTASALKEGYLIVRVQTRKEINMKLSNGRIESVATGQENGMGVQAFTAHGASGFASGNSLDEETAAELSAKAIHLAQQNERAGAELNTDIYTAAKITDELPNPARIPYDQYSPEKLQELAHKIHLRLLEITVDGIDLFWQTSFRQVEDFWCIGRSDGTLVSFVVPRAVLFHQGTVKKGSQAQSFSVQRSGMDAEILLAEINDWNLHRHAHDKAEFIGFVCDAPVVPSGHYDLIIDHGLAKGLAHEAFGHAVESDLLEESVLGENGKLRKGLRISGPGVDIVDGPIPGDWAYQPYSANGLPRRTVEIVKDGILQAGLGDIFSARKAGVEASGAGRAEYYGSVPLPRMSNIRLVSATTLPLPQCLTLAHEIQAIRETLLTAGELQADHHFLLLGYRGGQVNIKTGDFVFQCDGAVNLADPALPVYQAGIFSGKILSVLESVKFSIGPQKLDAIGTCGKGGQSVPSSGGGSGYMALIKNINVRLGGNASER